MTTNDDAKLLLDENFIAMDDNDPLDSMQDENSPFYGQIKYKKKSDFNFSSLWRKPKIGRRKLRSIGKNQVTHDRTSHNNSSLRSKGKYVKDRESFETYASVPLSDFDEAKDTLPFLHFKPGIHSNHDEEVDGDQFISKTETTLKERKVLNPKMFLTQVSLKENETKNQMSNDKSVGVKNNEEESRNIFKPIHITNNNFDAFQILSKESPSKVNIEDDTAKKQEKVDAGDHCDKENLFKDSFYGGDLYQDHGPILSSLSEDTLHSDSVRGERFLDENFNENNPENYRRCKLESSNDGDRGNQEGRWNVRDGRNQNNLYQDESTTTVDVSDSDEPSVRSFSDRLKLFQSKANQPIKQSQYVLSKSKSRTLTNNIQEETVVKEEEKTDKGHQSTNKVAEMPEIEKTALDQEKDMSVTECVIGQESDEILEEEHEVRCSESTVETTNSDRDDGRKISSKIEQQVTAGSRAQKQYEKSDSSQQIDGIKSFTSRTFRNNPSKFGGFNFTKDQSKVVNLSMLKTLKNQVADNENGQDKSELPTNGIESESNQENSKVDSIDTGEDSESNRDKNVHGLNRHDMSLHDTKNHWSSISHEKMTKFDGRSYGRRLIVPKVFENKSKPKIENVEKTGNSEGGIYPLESVSSDALKERSTSSGAIEASMESELKISEIKVEETHNLSIAPSERFGKRFEQQGSKFSRKVITNVQAVDTKQSNEGSFEKYPVSKSENSDDVDNTLVVTQSNEIRLSHSKNSSTDESKRKTSESLEIDIDNDGKRASSLHSSAKNHNDLCSKTLKDRKFSVRKSVTKEIVPSSELCAATTNISEEVSTEFGKKTDANNEVSNDSTTNTTISSLTCESIPHTSFAQQSASIFGVTLSKTRKKRTCNIPVNKEDDRFEEKSMIADVNIEKHDEETIGTAPHTNGVDNEHAKMDSLENTNEKNRNIMDEENKPLKISTCLNSRASVHGKINKEILEVQQEKDPVIVEDHSCNRKADSIHQSGECNENDRKTSFGENSHHSKAERAASPRKVKSLSISDRLKMFEKAAVSNRINFSQKSDDLEQDTARTLSPKSVEASGYSSFDDESIMTKRRSSDMKSMNQCLKTQVNLSTPDDTCSDNGVSKDVAIGRRKTLKSIHRGSKSQFEMIQTQQKAQDLPIHGLEKTEISHDHGKESDSEDIKNTDIKPEARSERLTIEPKEKLITENFKGSYKESSPPRNAYSARRKFFENLDRKRRKSFMSKPVEQPDPQMNHQKEHEIELLEDEPMHDSEDLPMFVTVEEDFMLRDNISTCLSASENRSVVCKPDAFLYSISQKAIASMSVKAESNSTISFSKGRNVMRKDTIDANWTRRLKSCNDDLSNNVSTTTNSCTQSKMSKNEGDLTNDVEDGKNTELLIDNQRAKVCRNSNISQYSNALLKKNKTSEISMRSKCDEQGHESVCVNESSDVKNNYFVESKPLKSVGTTSTFSRSGYNSFERKERESKLSQESNTQKTSKKETLCNVHKYAQGRGEKPQISLKSIQDKELHQRKGENADVVKNTNDERLNSNEHDTTIEEGECIPAKQTIPTNKDLEALPGRPQVESMSIKARRKFFESRCEKTVSVNTQKVEEGRKYDRKKSSSISNSNSEKRRESEDSKMTQLDSTSVAEKSEASANDNEYDATSTISDSHKNVSTQSSSRPAELNSRPSSTSTYTRGSLAAPMYRRGFSSVGIRSSTDAHAKKKVDLRCF